MSSSEPRPEERDDVSLKPPQQLTLFSKPTLKKLQQTKIITAVGSKWYELGIELLDEDQLTQLDIIKTNNHEVTRCCAEMFLFWLRSHSNATWQNLAEALKAPGVELNDVAATVETHFNTGLSTSQSSEVSQPVKETQEPVLTFDINEFDSITSAFLFLTSNVSRLLRTGDFYTIRRACIEQTNTPNGAQLSPNMEQKITSTDNLNVLLDTLALSPYWSWIDLRLLEATVVASGSVVAKHLLTSYKNAVFSKKLIDVIPEIPSKEVKDEYYTKIFSKFDKEFEEITIFDLLKRKSQLETVIMDLKKGTCALAHISEGCIEIHWFVPTNHIDHVRKAASLKRHKYDTLHLQYLQIGTMSKIYNPSILHSLHPDVAEPPLPVSAAACKDIIDHYYHYLTTEMDSDLIVEHMLSQQAFNDQQVHAIMSAGSRFQKNCLVLEKIRLMDTKSLVSFCEILQMFDCQKHIASVVLNAMKLFGFLSSVAVSQFTVDKTDSGDHVNLQTAPVSSTLPDKSRKRAASSEQPVGQKYFKPSSVHAEFLDIKIQLEQMLQASSSQKVYEQCKSLMASYEHEIALFSTDHLSNLKECNEIPVILQRLSPYFNWSDHSVLHALVQACNNPEATLLLQQFDSQVDLSLPITEYPVPQPVPSMAPYETSKQTVLAVKLSNELSKLSLQQVTELRCLIQRNFKITEHSLQLLAAKSSSAILYWMIPKCVSHLVDFKVIQDSSLHGGRVQEVGIYPGKLFISADILKLGSLSFLNEFDHMLPRNETEVLSMHLNHLEQLPNTMGKLQLELMQRETTKEHIMVRTEKDDRLDQSEVIISSEQSKPTSSHDTKAILKHVYEQNEVLRTQLNESKRMENLLQEQIDHTQKKLSDLHENYDELKTLSSSEDLETQLSIMQRKLSDVKSEFGSIDIIKMHYTEEPVDDISDEQGGLVVSYFQMFNKDLSTFEKWLKLLQTERITNEQKISKLQISYEENTACVTQLHHEMSEMEASMKMKETEIIKLKEDSKKFTKHFIQRKVEDQVRPAIIKEQLVLDHLIGSGQYGEVHKVNYNRNWFACKKIHERILSSHPNKQHSDQMDKLMKEITKLLQSTKHPNIEKYELVLEQAPTFLLLAELLPENLNKFITRLKEKMHVCLQVNICNDMTLGLQYLHSAGIVHRNLHSNNVLITHELHAKIADYICPQWLSVDNSSSSTTNKAFLAPEIKSNSLCTYSSDVFSLGMLFFQTVTTYLPADIDALSERKQTLTDPNKVPSHHPLHMVIKQCLTTGESARPSANEVCNKVVEAKKTPQYILSLELQGRKESPEFGHSLQSKRYKLQWTSCSKLPTAMYGAYATVINSTLYITGGWCPNDTMNNYNVYKYELDKNQWSVLPPLQQYYGIPVNIDDQLTIISGRHSTPPYKVSNLVLTYSDNSWNNTYPNLSVARSLPAVVSYHQYVIVAGGKGDDDVLDSIEVFDVTKSHWMIVNTLLPQPMYWISATICADCFTIVGYAGADNKHYTGTFIIPIDDIISLPQQTQQSLTSSTDKDNTKWHQLARAPYWATALVPNTSPPVIIGGSKQGNTVNDITIYDDTSNKWNITSSIPINCDYTTVAVINHCIIVMGGCSNTKTTETANATALSDVNVGQLVMYDED